VIPIYRVDQWHDLPYLVMPYVSDIPLQKRIDDEGPLQSVAILRIGEQIATGLAAAHAHGLIHRDIKPANILLEGGVERVRITDFGLARAADDGSLTRTGMIAGTPQYMSPEQARGESLDPRSDLFSLGSVIYAMCAGHPPFRAETPYGILRRITDIEPRPIREINPEIPDWLEAIVAKLHAKRAEDRFASAEEVAELLRRCLAHVQQPTTVALPGQCAKLCQGSLQRRSSPTVRESRRSFRLNRPAVRLLVIAVVASVSIAGVQLLRWPSQSRSDAPMKRGTADDPASSWDGNTTGDEIENLRHDFNFFELQANQLWNELPTNPTTNPNQ
jgi:serine/threonine protein kinase